MHAQQRRRGRGERGGRVVGAEAAEAARGRVEAVHRAEGQQDVQQEVRPLMPPVPEQLGVERSHQDAAAATRVMLLQRPPHHRAEVLGVAVDRARNLIRVVALLPVQARPDAAAAAAEAVEASELLLEPPKAKTERTLTKKTFTASSLNLK